ncbi:MAG: imidazole glycerol phosphate synthase subunit HisF [Betaproteobacteria bacterium]|nr:imidazole glycerol phosphate synthase subunit HisF [Betaproteobacteria bacterium]
MGLAVRVIPCLDVRSGRVVKGVNFEGIRDAGDPVEAAERYDETGADELCLLDITASHENRAAIIETVTAVAEQIWIPLTVGGGVGDEAAFERLLRAGADKVSINSAALRDRQLIARLAKRYGSQCVVVAIDAKAAAGGWRAYSQGGRHDTGIDAIDWARQAAELGAGEILLTSMDADGTCNGYDLGMIAAVAQIIDVPLIASGGAGQLDHFAPAIEAGADAVLAASVFHDRVLEIGQVKHSLAAAGLATTLPAAEAA